MIAGRKRHNGNRAPFGAASVNNCRVGAGCPIFPAMNDTSDNNKTVKPGFVTEIALLERRVEELLLTVDTLKEENRALRQRQESLAAERSAFAQRNDQVRARVEAMIGRLKTMEHTA